MKKNLIKKIINLKKKGCQLPECLRWRSWYSTIFFFGLLLVASVYFWLIYFYQTTPNGIAQESIAQEQNNFDSKKKKIEGAIEQLQTRKKQFEAIPDLSGQREFFIRLNDDGTLPVAQPKETEEEGEEEEGVLAQ